MVLSKSLKVLHKVDKDSAYSVLVEQKNYKDESLLFEADVIGVLCESWTVTFIAFLIINQLDQYFIYQRNKIR